MEVFPTEIENKKIINSKFQISKQLQNHKKKNIFSFNQPIKFKKNRINEKKPKIKNKIDWNSKKIFLQMCPYPRKYIIILYLYI